MASEPRIASCALDADGLRDQGARYSRLAAWVVRIDRDPGLVTVHFGPDVDRELLDRTLAIERECCPFFTLELDPSELRLRASVANADQRPALDALADALRGTAHAAAD